MKVRKWIEASTAAISINFLNLNFFFEDCEPYEIFAAEAQKIVNDTLDLLPERTREIFIHTMLYCIIKDNINLFIFLLYI